MGGNTRTSFKKGHKVPVEWREKLSLALAGRTHPISKSTRKKLSVALMGHPVSEETRRKISEKNKGNISWCKGKHFSEEHRLKLRIAKLGKKQPRSAIEKRTLSLKGIKRTKEWKRKMAESKMGNKNPMWKGGRSFGDYPQEFNGALKKEIKKRDHHTCQVCFRRRRDYNLVPHHIDYDKKNCKKENLISVCKDGCHSKINFNRGYWQKVLQKRVNLLLS